MGSEGEFCAGRRPTLAPRGWGTRYLLAWSVLAGVAFGGGPRYVTGAPFFTGPAGVPIGWKQANLTYYTDPGDLSASVNHAAADAMVAAAAGVWNVPVASISVAQGGELAEHVSGANVYLSSDGLVWPADVESSNAAAIPVAVVYDSDGSVTDTLLGAGASEPFACEQNAVTETVDAFDPAGFILHAIVVVNGRCTGPAPEQQLQIQYKLERAFGRVLGLAWSQTNDNVFTGTPQPTAGQANHWPILHPIEILCGPYSYQCLPNAFTLRMDDIAGLVSLYPIGPSATPAAGKQASLTEATGGKGSILFPDGEGMTGVNAVLRREPVFSNDEEGFFDVSAVSGSTFRRDGLSPFVSADSTALGSMGSTAASLRGTFNMAYVELLAPDTNQAEIASTEPVNPLYAGSASVGIYALGIAAPAGSPPMPVQSFVTKNQVALFNFIAADAPAACGNGADGTAAEPVAAPAGGWWNGLLCGYGHAAYAAVTVKPGRSLTVEATALDANGLATTTKAMPVIGLFASTDALGALPSLGVAPTAFNSMCLGMTALSAAPFAAGGAGGVVRVGVADERGEGRPDFAYQTRVFYADSAVPELVPAAGGGTLTISGMGFRAGNEVLVNGVEAAVVSSTSSTIVATVPTMSLAGATAGTPVDVELVDLETGATSTMTGALTYDANGQVPNTMLLVSAQTAPGTVGSVAPVPFAVQVLASDGATPVVGDTVVFSAAASGAGSAWLGACGGAICSVTTDANGMASTTVEPLSAGTVAMQATDGGLSVSASFVTNPEVVSVLVNSAPTGSVLVGQMAPAKFAVSVLGLNGRGLAGAEVTFSVATGSAGSVAFGGCNTTPCVVQTNGQGAAQVTVTPTAAGALTLVASSGAPSAQAGFTAVAVVDVLTLTFAPAVPAYVNQNDGTLNARLMLSDGVTQVANAPLTFSAPSGLLFGACGQTVCTLTTNGSGVIGTNIVTSAAGVYPLTVSYGSVSQTVQLTVTVPEPQLKLLSAPTGNVPVGTTAAQMLSAQVLDVRGNPSSGQQVTLGGALGEVQLGCSNGSAGSCVLYTDGNGVVSAQVTPVVAGTLTVEAIFGSLRVQSSFTSVGIAESLTVTSPPPATVNVGIPVSFTFQGIAPNGSPEAGKTVWVTTESGSFANSTCSGGFCKYYLDANGNLTLKGIAWVPGVVTISATMDDVSASVSFTAVQPAQSLNLVSAPSGNFKVGATIQPAFAVQLVGADGVTGVSGQNVTFSASGGNVAIKACALPCVVKTNGSGMASTGAITVNGTGTFTLTATDNGMTQAANFSVLAPPDVFTLASAPANVFVGATTTVPFAVLVTLADGITPAAGVTVNLSLGAGAGAAAFAACGAAVCSLTTNAAGTVSSLVTGTQAGRITLEATAQLPTGNATVSAPLTVQANVLGVTAAVPRFYVAAGATVPETLALAAVENGSPATGQAVVWTGGSGFAVSAGGSTTDATGAASMQATVGPLAGGVSATASGCVWTTICAQFTSTGVSAEMWQVVVVSGGNQSVSGGAPLQPVVVEVTDGAGHTLAGAAVTVGQTIRAYDGSCPAEGRCPVGATLGSGSSSGVSDANGRLQVVPMGLPGVATTTSLAFSAGSQGFATAVVSSVP